MLVYQRVPISYGKEEIGNRIPQADFTRSTGPYDRCQVWPEQCGQFPGGAVGELNLSTLPIAAWWFQTCFIMFYWHLLSISYMGYSFPLTFIFFKMVKINHQPALAALGLLDFCWKHLQTKKKWTLREKRVTRINNTGHTAISSYPPFADSHHPFFECHMRVSSKSSNKKKYCICIYNG